ncbi:MAG TPA: hypothetical protein VGF54_03060 [Streptosporangiaceae bacterium]|jgi:hypothetical protein
MARPSGEFGSTIEAATLTSEAPWLTGPLQNLSSLNKNAAKVNEQPVLIAFDVATVAGSSFTCFCESGIPDYWVVSVRPIAAVKVSLFLNVNNSGVPIRLSGGGYARLPGMSEYLTVVGEATSAACPVTVIAVRGYKHVEVDGGNLA